MLASRDSVRLKRSWWVLLALVLAFKLWLAAVFPYTGDEAYFTVWGAAPDLGFYDHPPMVGWLLSLLLGASWSEWVLRLPVVLLPLAVAAGIYLAVPEREKALLAAVAYLLLPVNVWNVLITTDTPLIFFSFFSALAYWQAARRGSAALYVLAGVLLGLAFLSKYFSVLLGLVYVAYAASAPRGERGRAWRGLALTVLSSLPFVAVNLWWNYQHCWANLMFNLYNRHGDAGWSWKTPLLYLVTVLYVLSPVALFQLARARGMWGRAWQDASSRFFLIATVLPFGLFALLSAVKLIGLHWVLSFVPLFFILAALQLSREQLRASLLYLSLFSLVHVALILATSLAPLENWKSMRQYDGIVFHFRINDILRELAPLRGEFELAADGYSPAVTLSYYLARDAGNGATPKPGSPQDWRSGYVFVFGTASSHARHDDILTDFRGMEGRNIAILRKNPPDKTEYEPYFRSVAYREFNLEGATFHIVLGRGFDYATYRERVLAPLRERYYRIPAYLPQGRCYFCERYFGATTCSAG